MIIIPDRAKTLERLRDTSQRWWQNATEAEPIRDAITLLEVTLPSDAEQQIGELCIDLALTQSVLKEFTDRFGGIENGKCKVCHFERKYDTQGNRTPCTNPSCIVTRAQFMLSKKPR